jgi:hypothetical protein
MPLRESERIDRVLKDFGRSCRALCKSLSDKTELGEAERLFLDNYLHLLHMTYSKWKREHSKEL